MSIHERNRRVLCLLIAAVAGAAAVWSAAMLVGGIRAAGQLESEWNPLGDHIALVAAGAIISATAIFYYVLTSRARRSALLLVICGALVAAMTVFASATQLVMVVDASMGESLRKGSQVRVDQAWAQARRIDAAMVEAYRAQLDHYAARMAEEAVTGRGPRYRAAARTHNRLRAEYAGALGGVEKIAQQGRSMSADIAAARGYLDRLRAKARVFARFAEAEGIRAPAFAPRIAAVASGLPVTGEDGWLDRQALVYAAVMTKLVEMVASFGLADLGFTLNALLSITPDLIQVLCACLLLMLRPEHNAPGRARGDSAWADGDPDDIPEWAGGGSAWGDISSPDGTIH